MPLKKIIFLSAAILVLLGSQLRAASVAVDLDKTTIRVREELHLVIRIEDAQGNIQAPRIQGIDGFDIFYTGRSSKLSFINGQSSSQVEFSYVLVPQRAGSFTLPPIEIQAGGQAFQTESTAVTVLPDSASQNQPTYQAPALPPLPQAYPQATPNASPSAMPDAEEEIADQPGSNDDIFVTATVDRTSVYPNEQILLTYTLYTRFDTRYEGFKDEPEVSGFWIEEFPMGQNIPRDTVRRNGKKYIRALVRKMALFPTAPADYTIQPGLMKASILRQPQSSVFDDFFSDNFFSGGGFFSKREDVLLNPQPIHVLVKPFPESGKPKSFQGATGLFRLQSVIDKQAVKQDEPVTLTLTIEGQGNIETLNKPVIPELPDFRTYDGDAHHELFKTGDQIGGRKTFEVVFIPTQPGTRTIPPLEFSFFNPGTGQYQVLKSNPFTIQVEKSDSTFTLPAQDGKPVDLKKDVEIEKRDIRYIQDSVSLSSWTRVTRAGLRILSALNGAAGLFLLALLFAAKRDELLNRNMPQRRKKNARAQAERKLRGLNKLMRKANAESQYFEEMERTAFQYFADRCNLSPSGITRYQIEDQLREVLGEGDASLHSLNDFFNICEASRFAKVTGSKDDRERVKQLFLHVMKTLETKS